MHFNNNLDPYYVKLSSDKRTCIADKEETPKNITFRCFTRCVALIVTLFIILPFTVWIVYMSHLKDGRACLFRSCEGNKYPNLISFNQKPNYQLLPDFPPHQNYSKLARYILHNSEWGALAIIPTHKSIENFTFAKTVRVSDGPHSNSSGVPYFYFTQLDSSVNDQQENQQTSMTVSLAQSDFCTKQSMNPEDHRCSQIIFTGIISTLLKDSDEEAFAKTSLFSRQPEMSAWPPEFSWYFVKMDIKSIHLLDFFGTIYIVNVKEYFDTSNVLLP